MGVKKPAPVSTERQRWERTYNNLVHILRNQQIQLETLLTERKLLEQTLTTQHERWASVVDSAQDQIDQMKRDMVIEEKARSLQAVKSELVVGLEQREAARLKLMLDFAEKELATDHKNYLDILSQEKCGQSKEFTERELRSNRRNGFKSAEVGTIIDMNLEILECEVQRLRAEYDKLALKKDAEVSALLLEKDFVWHQLKTTESNYADKLKRKNEEVAAANEKVGNLIARMEELQSSTSDKDKTIKELENRVAKMEDDARAKSSEMTKVSQELEMLRKSSNAAATPSLRSCSARSIRSNLGPTNDSMKKILQVKKEQVDIRQSRPVTSSAQGSKGAKRKLIDVITIPDTPKLFSASFKAPKLKDPSPSVKGTKPN